MALKREFSEDGLRALKVLHVNPASLEWVAKDVFRVWFINPDGVLLDVKCKEFQIKEVKSG